MPQVENKLLGNTVPPRFGGTAGAKLSKEREPGSPPPTQCSNRPRSIHKDQFIGKHENLGRLRQGGKRLGRLGGTGIVLGITPISVI